MQHVFSDYSFSHSSYTSLSNSTILFCLTQRTVPHGSGEKLKPQLVVFKWTLFLFSYLKRKDPLGERNLAIYQNTEK